MNISGETKLFAGIILATLVILVGGVFLFSKPPTPNTSGPKADAKLLVRDDSAKISSPSARVTLVEFADYQCPACGAYSPVVNQLLSDVEISGKVNFVFRNFPLSQHQNARLAAESAEAAGDQGKYWQMHDMIYYNQAKWSDANNAKDFFDGYAQTIGLDINKFNSDIGSDKIKQKVDRDLADGNALGVNATPTFYLDGIKLQNPGSFDDFKTLVKAELLKAPITQNSAAKYHIHANIKVYLGSQSVDFSQPKYQSTADGKDLDENIHFHDGNGDLIHIHKKGVTIGEFFKSLKMSFSKDCFNIDTGEKYCNGGGESGLKFFVNGKPNTQFDNYVPQDLDKLLISYGSDVQTESQKQINSVSDTACIYSLKCPERGTPPKEKCVGGLGTDCQD